MSVQYVDVQEARKNVRAWALAYMEGERHGFLPTIPPDTQPTSSTPCLPPAVWNAWEKLGEAD